MLTPQQKAIWQNRLDAHELLKTGVGPLKTPEVIAELKLNEDQIQQLSRLDSSSNSSRFRFSRSRPPFEEVEEGNAKRGQAMLDVLTKSQQAAWRKTTTLWTHLSVMNLFKLRSLDIIANLNLSDPADLTAFLKRYPKQRIVPQMQIPSSIPNRPSGTQTPNSNPPKGQTPKAGGAKGQPGPKQANKPSAAEAEYIFKALDKDKNGSLSGEEWQTSKTVRSGFEKPAFRFHFPSIATRS